jgi:hypothetical protein
MPCIKLDEYGAVESLEDFKYFKIGSSIKYLALSDDNDFSSCGHKDWCRGQILGFQIKKGTNGRAIAKKITPESRKGLEEEMQDGQLFTWLSLKEDHYLAPIQFIDINTDGIKQRFNPYLAFLIDTVCTPKSPTKPSSQSKAVIGRVSSKKSKSSGSKSPRNKNGSREAA